jgi:hypothetical protein
MQSNFTRPQKLKEKLCIECSTPFKVSENVNEKYQKKFCNNSCSASFNNKKRIVSAEQKLKTKETTKKRIKEKGLWGILLKKSMVQRTPKNCIHCNTIFVPMGKNYRRKTCSNECYKQYKILHMPTPKTIGGPRPGSGRSKSGYYKGIYCGSTYELCWVIYALDHGIEFQRFPHCLKNSYTTYYPDFLLGDNKTIIEIKGYENIEQTKKRKAVSEQFGFKFVMLKKENLTAVFEHVKNTYKTKNFATLYDNTPIEN